MKENPVVLKDLALFVKHVPFLEELKDKTFFITGATGLLGSIFIKCLLTINIYYDARIKIIGLARNLQKIKTIFGDSDIQWVVQDVTEKIPETIQSIDYIIHCANSTSSRFYVECPVENINTAYLGTNNILDYARRHSIKSMVYLSSLECYGTILDINDITENIMGYITPTDVRSSYSLGKRAVECLCHCYAREYEVPVKMARLTQTFGAGVSEEDNRVFAQFSKSIINGENIVLHTEGLSAKPYCYTIDAVRAILFILIKGSEGEAYNVANPNTYISIYEMAQFLIDHFNSKIKLVIEKKDNLGYAPITKLNLNTTKLQLLGWSPLYDLKEMYLNLINYYKTKF